MKFLKFLLVSSVVVFSFNTNALAASPANADLKLVIAMFNLAPDAAIYNNIKTGYEAMGKNLSELAANLSQSGVFISKTENLSADDKASYLLNNLNLIKGTSAGDAAKAYFYSRITNGVPLEQVAVEAITYLSDSSIRDSAFDSAAQALENKVTVAQYFISSGIVAETESDLDVLENVNADQASVDEAVKEIDNASDVQTSKSIIYKGIEYKTLISPTTGRIWLDRNLGALNACLSMNDTDCFGDYYQWGRAADGHEKKDSTTFTTGNTDWTKQSVSSRKIMWAKTDGTGICPVGYRVPTSSELQAENIMNADDAFKKLKIPNARGRYYETGEIKIGNSAIWSNSPNGIYSEFLNAAKLMAAVSNTDMANGYPVRCINAKISNNSETSNEKEEITKLNALLKNDSSNITVIYDSSLPGNEVSFLKDYHKKVIVILNDFFGFEPEHTFQLQYISSNSHLGFNNDKTILTLTTLPTIDDFFKTWYIIEMAHLYMEEQTNLGNIKTIPGYENKLRFNEFHSHAVTAIVTEKYGYALGLSSGYMQQYTQYLDGKFNDAVKFFIDSMDPGTLYSSESNYNGQNSTEILAAVHDILNFYYIDNNYFKNLFGKLKNWTSLDEYIKALASSMETIDYSKAKELVENSTYIKQAKEVQTKRGIEIVLMSKSDFPGNPSNMQFFHDTLQGIIITGISYVKDQYPDGTAGWDIPIDKEFFDSTAKVTIVDSQGNNIAAYNNVDIKPDLSNSYSVEIKPGLLKDDKQYIVNAAATIDGVQYEDTIKFNTFKPKITLVFDDTFPVGERKKFKEITEKMAKAYSWATHVYPDKAIKIVYDPNAYKIGWAGNFDTNIMGNTDDYEYWMFEFAHLFWQKAIQNANYVSSQAFSNYKTKWAMRDEEIIGQVVAKIAYNKYPDMFDQLSQKEKDDEASVFDEKYRDAMKKFIDTTKLYTIQQQDVNTLSQYINIPVDIYEITGLYKMDRNFLYHFFYDSKLSYTNYDEYKNLFIKSVKTNSASAVTKYVNNMTYFKQIDKLSNRPRYNIDVTLVSPQMASSKQFNIYHPVSFCVIGQSYNIDDYTQSTEDPERTGEDAFYNTKVTVKIFNYSNQEIYSKIVDIQRNIYNKKYALPNLSPGKYKITAQMMINSQTIKDNLDFEIK